MNSVVPHLNRRAKITVWAKNLATLPFGVLPDFCHLFVQYYHHGSKPFGRGVAAVTCHLGHSIQPFFYPVYLELLSYDLVVFVN
jgi:hypothetical protein